MITNGKVVNIAYILKGAQGEELDRADSSDPFAYLHGSHQIVPGLESALEGLNTGDRKQVTVPAADGYGEVIAELQIAVDKANFPEGGDIQPGMEFMANVGEGQTLPFRVMKVEGSQVHIDGNHPLAGQTLHFDVEIMGVRDATSEELEHGHAHGPHGHHGH